MQNNVDDLLAQNTTQRLANLRHKQDAAPPPDVSHGTPDDIEIEHPTEVQAPPSKAEASPQKTEQAPSPEVNEYGDETKSGQQKEDSPASTNEYGLETDTPRTFTQAEMDAYADQVSNHRIRERLARLERNSGQQATQQQTQQYQQASQDGFEFDENSNLNWQQQLESFVWQAAERREQNKAAQLRKAIEQERMGAFETKFKSGMEKFKDYHTVLSGKDITDAMVMAASDITDPAALFYAAAKRMPEELSKIAKIENPYAQAAAIGRLDEKLKKAPQKVSNAPKPITPTKADTDVQAFQPKKSHLSSLDEMLLADAKKRSDQFNNRRR